MLARVITGGQSGAEQAAWAAARRAGLETGGYMPRGFETAEGPAPRVGLLYGAVEFPLDDARRLRANLKHADALLVPGDPASEAARLAVEAAGVLGKPWLPARPGATPPREVARWLAVFDVRALCVVAPAGPALGAAAGPFFDRVFALARRAP